MSEPVIFIGYDGREAEAAAVCESSIRRHCEWPMSIQFLREPALRHVGLYRRQWIVEDGQKIDTADRRPFSTDFSFTRFLVPSLMQHDGIALSCDGDFLFTADVRELFQKFNPRFAVQVVKHSHTPIETSKMDGRIQTRYFRKNWSSLILWNCRHRANQRLTPQVVNDSPGQWLHAFSWLDDGEIGELPADWNWLSSIDQFPESGKIPKAIHFTRGIPTMPGRSDDPYADLWRQELSMQRRELSAI